MERSDFLKMCQQVAIIPGNGKFGMKSNVPENLQVSYKGKKYYPKSYTLWFDEHGKPCHSVVLHDLRANCEIECKLEEVNA